MPSLCLLVGQSVGPNKAGEAAASSAPTVACLASWLPLDPATPSKSGHPHPTQPPASVLGVDPGSTVQSGGCEEPLLLPLCREKAVPLEAGCVDIVFISTACKGAALHRAHQVPSVFTPVHQGFAVLKQKPINKAVNNRDGVTWKEVQEKK